MTPTSLSPAPASTWRLQVPTGTGWSRVDDRAIRTDCYRCLGSGWWSPCPACAAGRLHPADLCPDDEPCPCSQQLRAVLPRRRATEELDGLARYRGVPAGLLYGENGEVVSAIAAATVVRTGLAAISAAARAELGDRAARRGRAERVRSARVTGLLLTIPADRIADVDTADWLAWEAQPAGLGDPDAVAGVWAELA